LTLGEHFNSYKGIIETNASWPKCEKLKARPGIKASSYVSKISCMYKSFLSIIVDKLMLTDSCMYKVICTS